MIKNRSAARIVAPPPIRRPPPQAGTFERAFKPPKCTPFAERIAKVPAVKRMAAKATSRAKVPLCGLFNKVAVST